MRFSLLVVTALVCGLYIGLVPTLVDGLRKSLQSRLNLPPGRVEWFVRLFYLAWLPTMPLVGWGLDSWTKDILFYSLIALVLGMAWLALVRSFQSLLLNAVFLGVAYSGITTATVRLMTVVFFPPYDDSLTIASLNLGFVAVGLGALLGPWIVNRVERRWGYRQGLLYLSIVGIVPAALTMLCDPALFPKPAAVAASWEAVLSRPQMGVIAGVILLYFALENCLDFWPEPYLKELGYPERDQKAGLFLFWLSFIAMRGVAAWWLYQHPGQGFAVLFILAVLSALVIGNLAGGYDIGSGTFGFLLAGACYGPMLPGFLGMALDLMPDMPMSALGALLALSGLDTLLVRPIMHVFAKNRPTRHVMRVPAILALILAAPLLLLVFLR